MELNPGDLKTLLYRAARIIKLYEKFVATPYQDTAGIWTVGYGTTNSEVIKKYRHIEMTQAEAETYLEQHIRHEVVEKILPLIKTNLDTLQLVPIVSLVYNIGIGNFMKSPVLAAINNQCDICTIAQAFLHHTKDRKGHELRGLVIRRLTEIQYFKTRREPFAKKFYRLPQTEIDKYVNDIKAGVYPF